MPAPTVSVVIPTYNSVRYLAEAVESVLAQTITDVEVIVVDDGSTDGTQALMARYAGSVRYFRQDNSGVSTARNFGLAQSAGRYIAFLDADDTWFPNKLERQLEALAKEPDYHACYSAFVRVTSDLDLLEIWRGSRHGSALADLLTRGNIIGSVSVLCERKVFTEVGGFDRSLSQCADWDMWVRLAARTDFLYLDEPLLNYRQHGSNMSRDPALLERDSIRVLEKGFAMDCVPGAVAALRRHAFARNYTVLAGTYFGAGKYVDFLRCAARAVSLEPSQINYLAAYPFRVGSRLKARLKTNASLAADDRYGKAL